MINVLLLGDGPEERRWASVARDRAGTRLLAAFPSRDGFEGTARPRDLDDALALPGIDLAIVGGPAAFRGEALRRVAAEGLTAVCLHPPGPDSEAYYQVALSRNETGARLVPDLPLRLHPHLEALRLALAAGALGEFRGLRLEAHVTAESGDLARWHFARMVDSIRSLIGEIEAVTAIGDPPGEQPRDELVVQVRGAAGRRAEVRLALGAPESWHLVLTAADGSITVELPADLAGPSRRVERFASGRTECVDLAGWDPHEATLAQVASAEAGRPYHPDLGDATRAMEVTEGVVRSLRRGRTVELHYEEISEAGTFKSVMTSFGCMLLLAILVLLPIALGGAALGFRPALYLAYLIPPGLLGFLVLQFLRFAARDARAADGRAPDSE